jgi:hypothetical protein
MIPLSLSPSFADDSGDLADDDMKMRFETDHSSAEANCRTGSSPSLLVYPVNISDLKCIYLAADAPSHSPHRGLPRPAVWLAPGPS